MKLCLPFEVGSEDAVVIVTVVVSPFVTVSNKNNKQNSFLNYITINVLPAKCKNKISCRVYK